MRLGVISDTHDDITSVERFVRLFESEGIGTVIHLGDFVAPPTVKLFEGLNLTGIFGNNDGYKAGLIKTFEEIGAVLLGDFGETEIDGLKIALYHGEFPQLSESLALSGVYDVVFTGHFHKFEVKDIGKSRLLSPGSAHQAFSNDEGPAAAVFDTQDRSFRLLRI